MQQQQATTIIGVKATFVATNEHRFVALPTPPSFAVLAGKLASLFDVDLSELRVHYVDDESDRVVMSSSDELTCALSLVPAGRHLRLFVTIAACAALPSATCHQEDDEKQVKNEQPKEDQQELNCAALPSTAVATAVEATPIISTVECAVAPPEAASSQESSAIEVLKSQLQAAGVEVGTVIDLKRCERVLAKFGGDVAKAAKAIERMHARNLLRQQQHQVTGSVQEDKAAARQAQRDERLAARLARQDQKQQRNKHLVSADDDDKQKSQEKKSIKPVDAEAIDSLMTFIAGHHQQQKIEGAPIGRGKCTAAWRKADGDMEAAKAALLAWTAKLLQRQRQQQVDSDMAKLLEQLEGLGFGAPAVNATNDDADDNVCRAAAASERIQRRNERLIKRFGGDLSLVVSFLEARQAEVEAKRAAVRAARIALGAPRCGKQFDQEKKMQHVATAL